MYILKSKGSRKTLKRNGLCGMISEPQFRFWLLVFQVYQPILPSFSQRYLQKLPGEEVLLRQCNLFLATFPNITPLLS